VGGVAANSRLREKVMASAAEKELSVFIPSLAFCGDNAAMIAAAGYHNLRAGHVCSLTDDVYSKVMTLQHP
jgi:N6-L-threonylcarbamoyladenine synthase